MKRTVTLSIAFAAAAVAALTLSSRAGVGRAATVSAATPKAVAVRQDEFRWHEPLAAGRLIEIKGINGDVDAGPAGGGEVEVTAVKRGHGRGNPADVRIEVVRHAEGVTICAVYPSGDGKEPNTCTHDGSDHTNVRDNDTEVSFTVRVPAGVRFAGRTVNGNVEAKNLGAEVDAKTVNGNVEVSTTGVARAKTVNGSITAAMGRADWPEAVEFKTVNGSIDLSLPSDLSADIQIKTLNGEINSDFPLTVSGTFSRRRMSGTVGAGGRRLSLETVNGGVRIRRAS
jgi:Putative adhesin